MWPHLVVVLSPLLDPDLRVHAVPKPLEAQKLVAEFSVEGFVGGILPRLPRIDQRRVNAGVAEPAQDGGGDELRSVVRPVVCPGCEADCVMPVQTIPAGPHAAARFIVCDKRSDINRVALTTAHVDQWKCDGEALARFVVEQLGLRRSRHRIDESGTRPLGLAAGDTRHQMLGLRTHGDVSLVVADTAVALADLIDFARGAYRLDTAAIRHVVDAATTADPHYTPSTTRREAHTRDTQARYARWQRAYRALKQRRPHMSDVWYARQIAKQEIAAGCHASTIRKHMTGRPGATTRRG